MPINLEQLELNVNRKASEPTSVPCELYYVIASNEQDFRFAEWHEEPKPGEQKFYCYLTQDELEIPESNLVLKESYTLDTEPIYPIVKSAADFISIIDSLDNDTPAKAIRRVSAEELDDIKKQLEQKYGPVEKHVVSSRQGQHILLVFDSTEVSIAGTMMYFRHKSPISNSHYEHVRDGEA